MSNVFDKLRQQREPKPVKIAGETLHVRALLRDELQAAMQFPDDECSMGLTIAFGLVNADGTAIFSRQEHESMQDYGNRVLSTMNLPGDIEVELVQVILKLSKGFKPSQLEQLEKN